MDYDTYLRNEKSQTIHRTINTILMIIVCVIGFRVITPIYDDLSGLKAERTVKSELAQIMQDEGYKTTPYLDSRGLWTIGFGHLIKEGEQFTKIDHHVAVAMLRKDYQNATEDIERMYPWSDGEVKLVMINMAFQLGPTGLSKFKDTVGYLKQQKYDLATGEMLDSKWFNQTPRRALRLAGRVMQLE